MKQMFFVLVFFCELWATAQGPATEELLNVEKSFAALSVSAGTKSAFLAYLDSNSVVFEKGAALSGRRTWEAKTAGSGVLNWRPVYGFAAASGDMGFTTGPWTFREKNATDSILARGQYASIWKKNNRGEWKVIVDIGVTGTPSFEGVSVDFQNAPARFIKGTWNNLLNREQKFIQQTSTADSAVRRIVYEQAASAAGFFLNRNNRLPAVDQPTLAVTVKDMPKDIQYSILGSGISAGGEMGYVYGNTLIGGKREGYLRIWRREGKEWKLALEVLPF